jgi:hypothetical protein
MEAADRLATGDLDDPRLLLRADPGEDRGVRDRLGERVVVEPFEIRAASHLAGIAPDVSAQPRRRRCGSREDDLTTCGEVVELADGDDVVDLFDEVVAVEPEQVD